MHCRVCTSKQPLIKGQKRSVFEDRRGASVGPSRRRSSCSTTHHHPASGPRAEPRTTHTT